MDNDNKIEKKVSNKRHDEVLLFLDKELQTLQKGTNVDVYDIKEEFAKTRKNKSYFTWLLLAGTAFVIILSAFFITKGIDKTNEEITVSLEEFDSLNLRDLLDSFSKAQGKYEELVKQKSSLEADQQQKIRQAEDKRDNDLFVLESLKLSKVNYDKRAKLVTDEYNARIAEIKNEYAGQLDELASQIETYQKQLSEYDNSKVKQAQEKEKALNSERQLRQLEQREISEKYENRVSELQKNIDKIQKDSREEMRRSVKEVQEKYQAEIDKLDPVIKDRTATKIVNNTGNSKAPVYSDRRILEQGNIQDISIQTSLKDFQNYYDDYQYLSSKIAAIPQKNTIPSYVAANKVLVNQMGQTFTSTTLQLNRKNQELKEELKVQKENANNVFTGLLAAAKANAVIYSASNASDIQVFIAERARYLVDENEGVAAEFTADKGTVTGRVKLCSDGLYRFYTNEDAEGNLEELPVDISLIEAGTIVKLLAK